MRLKEHLPRATSMRTRESDLLITSAGVEVARRRALNSMSVILVVDWKISLSK